MVKSVNNVLYRHKSMAIIQAFKEIGMIMGDAVETLLSDKLGSLNSPQKQFIDELMVWCTNYGHDVLDWSCGNAGPLIPF